MPLIAGPQGELSLCALGLPHCSQTRCRGAKELKFKFTPAYYLSLDCVHFNPPANAMFSVEYDNWLNELR